MGRIEQLNSWNAYGLAAGALHAVGWSGFNMAAKFLDRLLSKLEESRYRFGRGEAARVVKLLNVLDKARFKDAPSLIRLHETLMFLRAFPQGSAVIRKTESLLNDFHKKVEALRKGGAAMKSFDPLEVSGIAGTQLADTLSFDVARWLVRRMPGKVTIDWDNWEEGRAMATALPRFVPLLDDDATVEADTPWRKWLEAAQGRKSASPEWLIRRFEDLPLPERDKAELYDSLRVPLRWDLGNSRVSRTRNWLPTRSVFYHVEPLISRREVSLAKELARRPPQFTKLSRQQGEQVMDQIREVMLVRYRELYGTTLGDPASVMRADVGRGVSIYLWHLPPARRLPLRAYIAGFTWKNGVPINYIEAIGLCEWMEVGFNTFYTFRGGEAGWVYAQALRCLCQLMGTTCVSVYPYQLGHDNDEAIDSGAFWFYRKLGFRPGRTDLLQLVEREEERIAADTAYKTPKRILRKLAAGHVFYELPGSEVGAWDRFSTRKIGLRVNARMARDFGGDAQAMREQSARAVARAVGVNPSAWTALEKVCFQNFAVMLGLIPDRASWKREEKDGLAKIIRAKAAKTEMRYLHLMQKHVCLRTTLLRLGS